MSMTSRGGRQLESLPTHGTEKEFQMTPTDLRRPLDPPRDRLLRIVLEAKERRAQHAVRSKQGTGK